MMNNEEFSVSNFKISFQYADNYYFCDFEF